jgi:serine protease Do
MGVNNKLRISVLALTAILGACSGETVETTVTTASDAVTTSTQGTTGSIGTYQGVQPAVIQIVAQGTFRDPELGYADGSGLGSGFIISPEGLAVTNNHVVAGAATLEVFIGGQTDTGYNATIVGVSECNDLALIDISESEPLPFLEWFNGEITPGLAVYAAGFPLGDPEYTLTAGIVSKAQAGGDLTGTSSIDHTIEHDANIQPGNSGGPLVAEDGTVVAVNYAGGAVATTTAQFYGIASDLAQPVITRLMDGDFETCGGDLGRVGGRGGRRVACRSCRHPPRRHHHFDERPPHRHRWDLQGLLRRDPHRRGQPDRGRCPPLRHLRGAAWRDQRRSADRVRVVHRRRDPG